MNKKLIVTIIIFLALAGSGALYKFKLQSNLAKTSSIENVELCQEHGFVKDECYQCNPQLLEAFKGKHDWCTEHNLPESQCEICDPFAKFKAKGDWCKEHSLPESQCTICDPSLALKQESFIDWCSEHGVPESQCTICHPNMKVSLKSDWCQEHNTRDSECTLCHPELRNKAKTTKPKANDSQWCEHGFEKGNCFSCDASLEGKFKKDGDWCGGHDVPESQCFKCQQGLQETVDKRLMISTVHSESSQEKRAIEVTSTQKELPVSASCGIHLLRIKLKTENMAETIGLKHQLVSHKIVSQSIKSNAEAVYNRDHFIKISSRFKGIVQKVSVELGAKVKKGDLLAILECPELGEIRQELSTQEKLFSVNQKIYLDTQSLLQQVKNSKRSVREISDELKNLTIGEDKAALLLQIIEIQNAEKQLQIQQELDKNKLGMKQKYLIAQKVYQSALTKFSSLLESISLKQQIRIVKQEGEVKQLRQKIAFSESSYNKKKPSQYRIFAGQDGTIINKNIVKGEIKDAGTSLFELCDLKHMWIKVDLQTTDAKQVKVGMPLRFTARGESDHFVGKITWLGSQVNDQTRMITVLAQVDSSKNLLRNNTYGQAKIYIHDKEQVLTIPKSALQWEGCCHVVFVKLKNGIYAPRKVKLGYEGQDYFVVEAGLLKGEMIVTQGSFLLKTEVLKSSIGAGCTD